MESNQHADGSVTISREELYRQVWREPMTMAWLELHRTGAYNAVFRFGGAKFRRQLQTCSEREAIDYDTRSFPRQTGRRTSW